MPKIHKASLQTLNLLLPKLTHLQKHKTYTIIQVSAFTNKLLASFSAMSLLKSPKKKLHELEIDKHYSITQIEKNKN